MDKMVNWLQRNRNVQQINRFKQLREIKYDPKFRKVLRDEYYSLKGAKGLKHLDSLHVVEQAMIKFNAVGKNEIPEAYTEA